ncbi:MAG: hypothetical protein ACYTET_06630, partial [Planctomycetota bacterium]
SLPGSVKIEKSDRKKRVKMRMEQKRKDCSKAHKKGDPSVGRLFIFGPTRSRFLNLRVGADPFLLYAHHLPKSTHGFDYWFFTSAG